MKQRHRKFKPTRPKAHIILIRKSLKKFSAKMSETILANSTLLQRIKGLA